MSDPEPLLVTKPFLPPLEEYVQHLQGVWERNYVTNQGPLVTQLEERLSGLLGASPVHYVCNGGAGLQIILKALGVRGEVVTTPFSYVATASCLIWEGLQPVFADIEPDHLTIDPGAVEAAITPRTEAILATHVYGNPCNVGALARLAEKHGLALIYDAAHCFGVRFEGRSILDYGDATMISLHATKVFHTIEGGLMHARDAAVSRRLEWMRRFGHNGEGRYHGAAINAKGTEFHAAMGLALLPHWEAISRCRREAVARYDEMLLACAPGLRRPALRPGTEWNHAYYPVIFPDEQTLLWALESLHKAQIHPRRYFWPALSEIAELGPALCTPIAADIARRVLVLPLHGSIEKQSVRRVAGAVLQAMGHS